MEGAQQLTVPRPRLRAVRLPVLALRVRLGLAVAALAALSFLMPSAPTYDPWAWVIWGRETLALDLSTVDGPSWKPLPVLLTTPFSLFGPLAPDLWLFCARAGAIAGVLVVFALARRIGGTVAGAAAASACAIAPWTLRNAALGNSEGLLVALALGAVDRHLAGRRRAAFALGVGAALLRPEVWPFLGAYGLWLLWRERGERVAVAIGFALLPLLWLVPEKLGSGDFLRAAHRAKTPNPNSPAFADDPIRAVVDLFARMLTPTLWVGIGVALLLATLALRTRAGRRDADVRRLGFLIAATGVLVAEVAYMTSDGFAGNSRYLVLPAALACVIAGVGVGWLARRLAPRLPRRRLLAVAALAAVAFALPSVDRLESTYDGVVYQARLVDGLATAIERAGGRERLLACGDPYAGPFQVPAAAWLLRVHTSDVQLEPSGAATVLRSRDIPTAPPLPALDGIGGEGSVQTFAIADGWRIVGRCR